MGCEKINKGGGGEMRAGGVGRGQRRGREVESGEVERWNGKREREGRVVDTEGRKYYIYMYISAIN